MNSHFPSWLLFVGLLVSTGTLLAQHQDILVYLGNGQARVGSYDFTVNQGDADYLVLSAELKTTEASPGAAYNDAPGWNAVSSVTRPPAGGPALPGNTRIHFDFLTAPLLGRNLLCWSGNDDDTYPTRLRGRRGGVGT